MELNESMQILHRMVQAGLLHMGVLLDISTGNLWSFVQLDVSTLETVLSLDGLFEGFDTKLLTLTALVTLGSLLFRLVIIVISIFLIRPR